MSKTIFVTGTDTGIGKTIVSAGIADILKEKKLSVGYFKPVETGCDPDPQDAKLLSKITGQPLAETVLYTYKHPVAPYIAEKLEKKSISIDKIFSHFEKLKNRYDYLIVEGAGGVCVPITKVDSKIYTYIDLIKGLKIPVLIVSRATLGTINHTCMTVKILKDHDIEIRGIILNLFTDTEEIAQKTNPSVIMEMTGIPVIAKCLSTKEPLKECKSKIRPVIDKIFN